ncbi:MAG: nicotinamide-nucleotide adenylyltransferase [Candidatus Nitrosocaldus sp.]|nr:nicotinamide-nucleotide adenylyltransferase [Candidatus Nitrosocaldus sp.]MCS7141568.1 nicotinamide-nucleotide adenylyltransferase [Candidatus Nitrosocaldus sp.]MDW8000489.1 nicotinamide-nucleotide adenylyltransferase [Candidatus Nitrosocaldus sp.]MDW8275149.1 nicotinamide-nucleotide adenylyltransferase [Candidatus Nitrosocaldus sp.]
MQRALIIGRFQPFHNGHLMLAREALRESDELIIAVTSAQFNYLDKDPFTAGERVWMIHEALRDEPMDGRSMLERCYVLAVQNDENNARWYAHIRSYLPPFHVVYTGNEYVSMLLSREGIRVKAPVLYRRDEYSASRIRALMVEGREWRHLVPRAVARIIDEIDGVSRMRIIARAESRPQEW